MSSQHSTSKTRLHWIDQTKGLAILGIVLFHFFQNYPDRFELVQALYRSGARWGYAAVDIFFVIAGFNTSYTLASLLDAGKIRSLLQVDWALWLKKRLSRLYPTYWLAVLVTLLLYAVMSRIEIKSILDFGGILIGLTSYERFKTINPGFWFFSVILQAYLVIPLIFYLCKSKPQLMLILGILGGLITKITCLMFYNQSGVFWFMLQNNFLGSYFFQLGLGLYWGFIYFEYRSFRKVDIAVSAILFTVGILLYSFLVVQRINFVYKIGFDIAFTPLFFILLYWMFDFFNTRIEGKKRFFPLLGNYSYQIYLIHQPLLFVLLPYLVQGVNLDPYARLLLSLVSTTVVLTIYVVAFTQVESLLRKLVQKTPRHSV